MNIVLFISDLMIPLTIVGIIAYGLIKRAPVYDSFLGGAVEGVKITTNIFPTLVGLMVAVGVLRASGTLDFIANFLAPLTRRLGFPEEALPLTLMRLVSSSAATGLQLDVYATHGPDSFIGRFVSVMMSSTETVFYTFSVYFLHIGITKTRYTLFGALFANVVSIIASLIITILVFGT
ncbi:MAG: spore maturation protein [Defluviitaleaceae bacterium]|nr:spore maturation protein [Defluviitaleaceae bacterium]